MYRPFHLIIAWIAAVLLSAALPLSLVLLCPNLRAQDDPERQITLVVPFPPGGVSMRIAEALAPVLARVMNKPVTISNLPGDSGALGARHVVHSAADGYTLLIAPSSLFLFDAAMMPASGYVPERDLDPLIMAVRAPSLLTIHPSIPARTLDELVAYMKAHPRTVRFAASGVGSINDLLAAQFWQDTGTEGTMTYFHGGGALLPALVAGDVQASFQDVGVVAPAIRTGALRPIAVTGDTRTHLFPNVPTFEEAGLPELDSYTWQAVAAPVGLPPALREALEQGLRTALLDHNVMSTLQASGSEVIATSSRQLRRVLAEERTRWRSLLTPAPDRRQKIQ